MELFYSTDLQKAALAHSLLYTSKWDTALPCTLYEEHILRDHLVSICNYRIIFFTDFNLFNYYERWYEICHLSHSL